MRFWLALCLVAACGGCHHKHTLTAHTTTTIAQPDAGQVELRYTLEIEQ